PLVRARSPDRACAPMKSDSRACHQADQGIGRGPGGPPPKAPPVAGASNARPDRPRLVCANFSSASVDCSTTEHSQSLCFLTYSACATFLSLNSRLVTAARRAALALACRVPSELTANPESSCSRSLAWHDGHAITVDFSTTSSNSCPQLRHL